MAAPSPSPTDSGPGARLDRALLEAARDELRRAARWRAAQADALATMRLQLVARSLAEVLAVEACR